MVFFSSGETDLWERILCAKVQIGKERPSQIAFCYVTSLDCLLHTSKATKKAFPRKKFYGTFEAHFPRFYAKSL